MKILYFLDADGIHGIMNVNIGNKLFIIIDLAYMAILYIYNYVMTIFNNNNDPENCECT